MNESRHIRTWLVAPPATHPLRYRDGEHLRLPHGATLWALGVLSTAAQASAPATPTPTDSPTEGPTVTPEPTLQAG